MTAHRLKTLTIALTAAILAGPGCNSKTDKVYTKAYNAQYDESFRESRADVDATAISEAQKLGVKQAATALDTATAWSLYQPLALVCLAIGITLGVSGQYAALLYCRRKRAIPEFCAAALIPGIRRSRAYPMLQMIAESDRQLKELEAVRQLKAWQVQAIREFVGRKLHATSELDSESQARTLRRAKADLDKIVRDGEQRVRSVARSRQTPPPFPPTKPSE